MAYPERPAFYPVMSMPCGNSATLLRNTNRPVMRNGPPPPPPPFLEQGYPPPPPGMGFPFPPPSPNGARFPPPPPPPPSNMEHNIAAPMPFKPFPPSNMQGPLTPPSSAPPTPLPVLELNQQNEILTQRWQWLPSMLCSIADDPTGDVYKIITITWDGSCKDCYLKRVGEGGVVADKGKDVFEKDLIPIGRRDAMPPPPPCREFSPPLSERGFSPPPSDLGSDHGAPIMVNPYNGGGPGPGPAFNGGFQNGPPPFPGPRDSHVEEYTSDDNDEDDGYETRPPLSPAMAARGVFPADEEYYSNSGSSPNWNSSSDDFSNDHDQGFIAIRLPDREPGHHESSSSLAKKSSGSGKKHKKRHHHGERSASENKERGSEKGGAKKSSSKGRSRRGSTSGNSNKSEDEKKEKKGSGSSHRGRREKHGGGKPGLFYFGS